MLKAGTKVRVTKCEDDPTRIGAVGVIVEPTETEKESMEDGSVMVDISEKLRASFLPDELEVES